MDITKAYGFSNLKQFRNKENKIASITATIKTMFIDNETGLEVVAMSFENCDIFDNRVDGDFGSQLDWLFQRYVEENELYKKMAQSQIEFLQADLDYMQDLAKSL